MCEGERTLMRPHFQTKGPFIGELDDYREVVEAGGCMEETSDSEILDGSEEEMRGFRRNASEEDDTFINMVNRPQFESRVEEVSHHPQSVSKY